MLYVFHGEDQFRALEALRELRGQLDRDGNLAHNTVRFDEHETRALTPAELRGACHTASFFEESRLVIIEGLLKRLGGGARRRGRRGRQAPDAGGPTGEADEFIGVLASLPDSTTVILMDETTHGLLELLPEGAAVRAFPRLRKDEVPRWAADHAARAGAKFAPGALAKLLEKVDSGHTGEMAGEIDKLATYAGGRAITIEDVEELVSGVRDFMPWDLTDPVLEGRADKALLAMRSLLRDRPPIVLAASLTRSFRNLLLAQALLREGLGTEQIGARLGLRDYPLRKTIEQASRISADALEAAYRRILESDVAVKTGVLEDDTSLEVLIVALSELAGSPRRASARR